MKRTSFFFTARFILLLTFLCFQAAAQQNLLSKVKPRRSLDPDPVGLYAIWLGNKPEVLNMPGIKGGQVTLQWGEIETQKGVYDWSQLDEQMRAYHDLNMYATLQINGNLKPEWMFEEIPYYPGRLSIQVREDNTLMFWHPLHKQAYKDLLADFARHLSRSPYMKNVIGVRLNPNAYGTEQHGPTGNAPVRDEGMHKWIFPQGKDRNMEPWSKAVAEEYLKDVVKWHVDELSPITTVFVRNGIPREICEAYEHDFRTGKLAWFHTSSEAETRGNDDKYLVFIDYCRTRSTLGYAEPWASAWGYHGGITDPRFCSPEQWNYWRVLMDINCGISYLSLYRTDLDVGYRGILKSGEAVPYASMQQEFNSAFSFAEKYTGTHRDPATSPGAWAALRQCDTALCWNRPIKLLTEDYTHLSLVQPGNSVGLHNVGPDTERFGAWARKLPQGESLSVVFHPAFTASVEGKSATLKIIYLDQGRHSWSVAYTAKTYTFTNKNSGKWKEALIAVTGAPPVNTPDAGHLVDQAMVKGRNKPQIAALNPDVTLCAISGDPVFHMVELLR